MFSFVFGVFTLLGVITNTTVVVFKVKTLFIIKTTMLSSSKLKPCSTLSHCFSSPWTPTWPSSENSLDQVQVHDCHLHVFTTLQHWTSCSRLFFANGITSMNIKEYRSGLRSWWSSCGSSSWMKNTTSTSLLLFSMKILNSQGRHHDHTIVHHLVSDMNIKDMILILHSSLASLVYPAIWGVHSQNLWSRGELFVSLYIFSRKALSQSELFGLQYKIFPLIAVTQGALYIWYKKILSLFTDSISVPCHLKLSTPQMARSLQVTLPSEGGFGAPASEIHCQLAG